VRHALSLDERSSLSTPLLWDQADNAEYCPHATVQQVWFAGVHSDVGGGYALDEAGLACCAMDWRLGEADALGCSWTPGAARHSLPNIATALIRLRQRTAPMAACGA
jgi:uncharacterized protein (DUF2235 family)